MRVFMACLLVSCFALRAAAQNVPASPAADVVHYKGTIDNVKYVFGVAPPVARLRPGNILDANSLDCFGNGIQKPGDTTAMAKGDNPLTGPFFIEGAEPGDTLVVHILDLQVDGNQGVGAFSPRIWSDQFHTLHAGPRKGAVAGKSLVLSDRPRR